MKLDLDFILAQFNGVVIVDESGIIQYISDNLAWEKGELAEPEAVVGRHVLEVLPKTHILETLALGTKRFGDIYQQDGYIIASNSVPLKHDDKIIGAIEYDILGDEGEHLAPFLQSLERVAVSQGSFLDGFVFKRRVKYTIDDIVGNSAGIQLLKQEIKSASHSNSTVLVEGETGCGKELVSHAIHAMGQRSLMPFIRLNCSEIPENLIETELFGYEEGSFTGGKKGGKKGKVELCHGGTLLLDEINHLPLSAQPKLLRFLQEKEINRVGGAASIPVDVRVIVTSNESLRDLVDTGRFREDLYFRLNVVQIKLPPLRERREDIRLLVKAHVLKLNDVMEREVEGIAEPVFLMLESRDWRGNVRELHNAVEYAMNNCFGDILRMEHFQRELAHGCEHDVAEKCDGLPFRERRAMAERSFILEALRLSMGNKVKAAELLEISKSLIHKKIRKYAIKEWEYRG